MIYNLIIDLVVNGIMLIAGILILKAIIRKWENWLRLYMYDRIVLNPDNQGLKEGGPVSAELIINFCSPPDRNGSLCGTPCGATQAGF